MYRIIGSDGKEYGPVSLEQLRQWIGERRVNYQTRVLPESGTEWTTLGALPEFASPASQQLPGITAIAPPPADTDATQTVQAPAIVLMVVSGIGFCWSLLSLFGNAMFATLQTWRPPHQSEEMAQMMEWLGRGSGIASSLLGMACSVFIIFSALQMSRLRRYGLAFAGAILVMIPCLSPCCCLGFPVGIWALIVLNRPEVRAAFQ